MSSTKAKKLVNPNTTLYPVPVVLIGCGKGESINVFSLNRIASCNAEPPMVSISVRPQRASHDLIEENRAFTVNLPWPDMEVVSDFVGTTSLREINKWDQVPLTPTEAHMVRAPLIDECPVNLECQVQEKLSLPSHSLFIAEVVAIHADVSVLNDRLEVDFDLVKGGLAYAAGQVRERPLENFQPEELLVKVQEWQRNRPRK